MESIPFHQAAVTGREAALIEDAIGRGQFSGDGAYTRRAEALLEDLTGAGRVLLTNSCSAALGMSALLLGLGPGDEVLVPAWTFPSTASAFMATGATPVFVDIDPGNLGMSVADARRAITSRTRALVVVHYGGGAADIRELVALAREHGLFVVEDAAQSLLSTREGRHLGTFGDLGTLSFHATKNIHCGEGGALLVNRPELRERAEWIRNKGTNRRDFLEGRVRHYQWQAVSAPAMASELSAAFLCAQLEAAGAITASRRAIRDRYEDELGAALREAGIATQAMAPDTRHNGHMFPLVFPGAEARERFRQRLSGAGIATAEHYQPLHLAPAGASLATPPLPVTEQVAAGLLRLPLWPGMPADVIARVTGAVRSALGCALA